jgi:hypothetical protein
MKAHQSAAAVTLEAVSKPPGTAPSEAVLKLLLLNGDLRISRRDWETVLGTIPCQLLVARETLQKLPFFRTVVG